MNAAQWVRYGAIRVLLLSVLLWAAQCGAQEIHVLALSGDGSASVLIDEAARVAYIIDGGRTGNQGIAGALIDGKPVLDYLSTRVDTLVIACSHPHLDHMGGLKTLVQSAAINRFRVGFIDDKGGATDSLAHLYVTSPARAKSDVAVPHASSVNNDAFTEIRKQLNIGDARMSVRNFIYDPAKIGESIHDQSMITEYSVGPASQSRRMVDFDDASTKLVTQWAARSGARADVLIYPHHGSRYNEISPLLNDPEKYHFTDVVISVNRQNRFFHPSPEVLARLVEKLGPEHVYVTDSDLGNNIRVKADGTLSTGDNVGAAERLGSLVESRIEQAQARLRAMVQKAQSSASAPSVPPAGENARERFLGYLRNSPSLDKRDSDRAARLLSDLDHLTAARRAITRVNEPARDPLSPLIAALDTRRGPDSDGNPHAPLEPHPTPPGQPGSATEAVPGQPEPHGGGGSGGSEWVDLHTRGGGRASTGGGGGFKVELARGMPRFGGVIVGNATNGPVAKRLEFVALAAAEEDESDSGESSGPSAVYIRITLKDGRMADYTDITPVELEAAYNLVQPTSVITAGYKKGAVRADDPGLVGMYKNNGDSWQFGIHPAIADTPLAQDAMRLDMFLAAGAALLKRHASSVPEYVKDIPLNDLKFNTYQWYDAESNIMSKPTVSPSTLLRARRPVSCACDSLNSKNLNGWIPTVRRPASLRKPNVDSPRVRRGLALKWNSALRRATS